MWHVSGALEVKRLEERNPGSQIAGSKHGGNVNGENFTWNRKAAGFGRKRQETFGGRRPMREVLENTPLEVSVGEN
jgi:hypothetical protein